MYNIKPRCDSINILYNPLQKDFIPINKNLSKSDKKELLNNINDMLIPNKLQGILDTEVAGILRSKKNQNEIIGYVDNKNIIKTFETPIEVKFKEDKEDKEVKAQKCCGQ